MKRDRHIATAFTLVEMLVVIFIITILLVALIPAVNSISKSNGRKAAASNLVGAVDQARGQAIKDQLNTYLAFPVFSSSALATTVSTYNYKSYAVFEDDPASVNPSGAATAVKQLTKWTTLPTGISIRNGSIGYLVDITTLGITAPTFAPDKSSTPVFHCVQFNNNGEVLQPPGSSSFYLTIFEGFVAASGSEQITSATSSGNPTATETVTIQRYTGRAEAAQ